MCPSRSTDRQRRRYPTARHPGRAVSQPRRQHLAQRPYHRRSAGDRVTDTPTAPKRHRTSSISDDAHTGTILAIQVASLCGVHPNRRRTTLNRLPALSLAISIEGRFNVTTWNFQLRLNREPTETEFDALYKAGLSDTGIEGTWSTLTARRPACYWR